MGHFSYVTLKMAERITVKEAKRKNMMLFVTETKNALLFENCLVFFAEP